MFHSNSVRRRLFADDKQLYSGTTIADIDTTHKRIISCILDVHDWCASRWLQLNAGKTEPVWFGTTANLHKMSAVKLTLSVGDNVIMPVYAVHNLGVHLDAKLAMKQHVNPTQPCHK